MKKLLTISALVAIACTTQAMADDVKPEVKAQQWFSKADTNADGRISAAENAAFASVMFTAADTDRNGEVTLQELTAYKKLEMPGGKKIEEKSQYWFKKLDANNDGEITTAENSDAAAIKFAEADTNKDGFITLAEAVEYKRMEKEEWKDAKDKHIGSTNTMKGSSTVNLPNRTNANPTDHSKNATNPSQENR